MAEGLAGTEIEVELMEADIPGASLNKPLECRSVPELRWWLLTCVMVILLFFV